MQIKFSSYVERDLQEIANRIAEDNPRRAVSFIREIQNKIRILGEEPLLYRLRPEVGQGARLAVIGNYVVLFRVVGEVVRVERVVFGDRNLPGLM